MTSSNPSDGFSDEEWLYDLTAEYYSTDMGSSMPFDDVGWYRELCKRHGGRVLELGCGTGRILLELLAAGIDASGIDRSLPMLRQLRLVADQRRISLRVAQMDIRALCLAQRFDVILAPYSLITCLSDTDEATLVLVQLREQLAANGRVVIDAFVPRLIGDYADFRLDYRRPHNGGFLQREKRINILDDGRHRIFRRYTLLDCASRIANQFTTTETIRPYSAADVNQLAESAGLRVSSWHFDYGTKDDGSTAQFSTAVLHSDRSEKTK